MPSCRAKLRCISLHRAPTEASKKKVRLRSASTKKPCVSIVGENAYSVRLIRPPIGPEQAAGPQIDEQSQRGAEDAGHHPAEHQHAIGVVAGVVQELQSPDRIRSIAATAGSRKAGKS